MKDKSLKDEYRIEAAPEDAEGEVVELRCFGGPSPFLTYDDLMKKIEVDPLLKAIVDDRVAQIAARWLRPELMGFKIECKAEIVHVNAETGVLRDPMTFHPGPAYKTEVVHTPEQLKQIYLDEKARHHAIYAQMAASEMDWEDDEEITQPGLSPRDMEIISAPIVLSPSDLTGGYPRITTDGITLLDRCYFCATPKNITRFERSAQDHITTCVYCLYDHLRWELMPDGGLRRVPADT